MQPAGERRAGEDRRRGLDALAGRPGEYEPAWALEAVLEGLRGDGCRRRTHVRRVPLSVGGAEGRARLVAQDAELVARLLCDLAQRRAGERVPAGRVRRAQLEDLDGGEARVRDRPLEHVCKVAVAGQLPRDERSAGSEQDAGEVERRDEAALRRGRCDEVDGRER